MQPSEEIKSRLDIVDVIRDYIQLQAAGSNFRARCPFHRENSASFMVSPEKQIWHCFGCGKGGDMFTFVMEIEGVNFVEALKVLAPKAGVTLKKMDPRASSERNKLMDIMDISRKHYHKVLTEKGVAKPAREYLAERGLTDETIEEWQIGFSLDSWDALSNILKENNFKEDEVFKAGMNAKNSSGSKYFDRFRARIMFPINDANCNPVAFSARVSPEREATEKMGKYMNSPQTPIYDKSRILFGLDKAKMEIKNQDLAIVVEGQMDVIQAHQAGFKNVVASSGTALTTEQIVLLKRFTKNIALAFDMDQAGEKAADRGIKAAMAEDMNIKVIQLPEGLDPDDCIKQDPEIWVQAVKDAKPMMKYYFDKYFKDIDIDDIHEKRKVTAILLPIILKLVNSIEQDYWIRELSQRLDVAEHLIREALVNSRQSEVESKTSAPQVNSIPAMKDSPKTREEKLSEMALAFVLKYSNHLSYLVGNLSPEYLAGDSIQTLYKNLVFYYNKINSGEVSTTTNKLQYLDFKQYLSSEKTGGENEAIDQSKILDRLVLLGDKEYPELKEDKQKAEILTIVMAIKKEYLNNKMKEIGRKISKAEKEGDSEEISKFMEEFRLLSAELRNLNN